MSYFTIDDLRGLPDVTDPKYADETLQAAIDWIVGIVEERCDTSFVATTVTDEQVSGTNTTALRLASPYVHSVTAVTVDGVAYTSDEIAALVIEDGYLYLASGLWPNTARGNVTVSYVAGYSTTPPADLKQAMMRGARQWVLTTAAWSGADSRSTAISNEWGNIQLSVAGEDRPTGVPDVDATIMRWAHRVRVPKVG